MSKDADPTEIMERVYSQSNKLSTTSHPTLSRKPTLSNLHGTTTLEEVQRMDLAHRKLTEKNEVVDKERLLTSSEITEVEEVQKLARIHRRMSAVGISIVLSDKDIEEIFCDIDVSKSGHISIQKISEAAMEGRLGLLHSEECCQKFVHEVDEDGDGLLSLSDFRNYIRERELVLQKVFSEMDQSQSEQRSTTNHPTLQRKPTLHELQRTATLEDVRKLVHRKSTEPNAAIDENEILTQNEIDEVEEVKRLANIHRRMSAAGISTVLSEEDIEEMFRDIDVTNSGLISMHIMTAAAMSGKLGLLHSEECCRKFMHAADEDGDGLISLSDFRNYIREREQVLHEIFNEMDQQNRGAITALDILEYSQEVCGHHMSLADAENIVAALDSERVGALKLDKFVKRTVLSVGDKKDVIQGLQNARNVFFLNLIDDHAKAPPPYLETGVSSLMAGFVSRTLTAPLDRTANLMRAGLGKGSGWGGILPTLKYYGQKQGLRALWAGNLLNCLAVGPESALMCNFYFGVKDYIYRDRENPTHAEKLLASGIAGWLAMTVVYPIYVIKDRYSLDITGRFKNVPDFIRQSYQREGLLSYYRGYAAFSGRAFFYRGLQPLIYVTLKNGFFGSSTQQTLVESMLLGAAAATAVEIITAPLNTARIMMMRQGPVLGQPWLHHGIIDCLKNAYWGNKRIGMQPQGWSGVLRGLEPNICKTAPAVAIQYAVFEQIFQLVQRMH